MRKWRHILTATADHFLRVECLACLIELAALIDLVKEGQTLILLPRLCLGLLSHLMIHELQVVYTNML